MCKRFAAVVFLVLLNVVKPVVGTTTTQVFPLRLRDVCEEQVVQTWTNTGQIHYTALHYVSVLIVGVQM